MKLCGDVQLAVPLIAFRSVNKILLSRSVTIVYSLVYRARKVIHGVKYQSGAVIRLQCSRTCVEEPFTYCVITDILIYEDHKVFCLEPLKVTCFCAHTQSFQVSRRGEKFLALFSTFYCHGVLHFKESNSHLYIVERDHWAKGTWCC